MARCGESLENQLKRYLNGVRARAETESESSPPQEQPAMIGSKLDDDPRQDVSLNECVKVYANNLSELGTLSLPKEWHSQASLIPEALYFEGAVPKLTKSVVVKKGFVDRYFG